MSKKQQQKNRAYSIKFLLSMFLFFTLLNFYAQTKELTFYDDIGEIKEPLSLNIYTQGELLNLQSDTKGKISLEKEMISKADSIFVNYSFYKLPLKKEDFAKEKIQLKPEISLESVILKEKKKQFFGPDKKNSIIHLNGKSDYLISAFTKDFKNKNIIGVRYRFKNKTLFFKGSSKNKRFKVSLYGYSQKAEKGLVKNNNKAYNLLGASPVTVSIPDNIPKWVEVYFDDEINPDDYLKYNYLAFGLLPIDTPIILKTAKQKKFEDFIEVNIHHTKVDGKNTALVYLYNYFTTNIYIPNIQLILK